MQFTRVESQTDAFSRATLALTEQLQARQGQSTVLLLSGGSAENIYQRLAQQEWDDLSWLQVGQVDERWGEPDHTHSNQRLIKQSGLVEAWQAKGARFGWVLTGQPDPFETALAYEQWLQQAMADATVLAVLGIGPDGHTAGILPYANAQEFTQTFPTERWYVAYTYSGETEFPQRLTLTPSGLQEIDWITGVAWGENKQMIWIDLEARAEKPLHTFPAQILKVHSGQFFGGW